MNFDLVNNLHTLSQTQAALLKDCSKQTLWNNREKFDWEGSRVVNNKKFKDWHPDKTKINKKFRGKNEL